MENGGLLKRWNIIIENELCPYRRYLTSIGHVGCVLLDTSENNTYYTRKLPKCNVEKCPLKAKLNLQTSPITGQPYSKTRDTPKESVEDGDINL